MAKKQKEVVSKEAKNIETFWNDEIIKKIVLFPNDNGGLSILRPSPRFQGTIDELAKKDVPTGKPYIIMDAKDEPKNRTYRNAWTANFDKPDGHGE